MKAKYLYHLCPQGMIGASLFPLNQLKEIKEAREAYSLAKDKYFYRPELLDFVIPRAECFFNDVLHFSPVNIKTIARYFIEHYSAILGQSTKQRTQNNDTRKLYMRRIEALRRLRFYKVDISNFDKSKLFILKIDSPIGDDHELLKTILSNNVYSWEEGKHLLKDEMPIAQIEYIKRCVKDSSLSPYMFTGVNHVLYKGIIEVSEYESL